MTIEVWLTHKVSLLLTLWESSSSPAQWDAHALECLHTFVACKNKQLWLGPKSLGGRLTFFQISLVLLLRFWQTRVHLKAKKPLYPKICKIFLSRTSWRRDFAKFSCRKIFLFYSISVVLNISEISEVSIISDVSVISYVLNTSEVLNISQISVFSDVLIIWKVLNISDVSVILEVLNVSKVLNISKVSVISEVLVISVISESLRDRGILYLQDFQDSRESRRSCISPRISTILGFLEKYKKSISK